MMNSSAHMVNFTYDISDELVRSERNNLESIDPLHDIRNDIQCKYYRTNSVVFAEPLRINFNENNAFKEDIENPVKEDHIAIIDNVLVQKRPGKKYKKYHINVADASNLCCPQTNCNRKFSKLKLLKAHIRKVHCSDKQFVCEVCGRAFSCRYLLVRHTAVHEENTVQCSICAMALSKSSLSAHLRTHSGVKLHTCSICSRQFSRKSTLDTHVKFVHRQGQLECHKCDARFETRSQWTRHKTSHQRTDKEGGATT